ncbi:MAG: cytochrome P450 [Sandaracinaceae bacterium]|nr:cytochrome P450 [Myxococcales bacterium]MCB9657636.1 cytochrome P450 [Sandaracinaceae bacterium]
MRVLDLSAPAPLFTGRPIAPTNARLAPSPKGDPLIGHQRLARDPLYTFLRLREEHGDVVRLQFGTLTAHLVSDPALVQTVLQDRARIYGKQTRGMRQLRLALGEGLLTSEGDFWLRQRRIAQPAFHKKRIDALTPAMTEAAERTRASFVTGEAFDMHGAMMRLTLDVVATTLLGSGVVEREARIVGEAVDFITAESNRRLRKPFQLPLSIPTPQNRSFLRHRDNLDAIVFRIIDEHRRAHAVNDDLLSLLLHATDPETGERMSDAQLRDEVMTIFLAGHETTANALSWAFVQLSRHPLVAQRLKRELDEVLEGRSPTLEDVPSLVYTRQVIDEVMRLYPPAWMIARSPTEDDELGGYFIPRGSLVLMSPWVVQRHPALFPNPEGFDPDRFAPGTKLPHRFAYFPFGGGPRLCIGRSFALVEATLLLATLAGGHRFDLIPGHRVVPESAVTLRPAGGVPMVAMPHA